jgi:hypothetical protein
MFVVVETDYGSHQAPYLTFLYAANVHLGLISFSQCPRSVAGRVTLWFGAAGGTGSSGCLKLIPFKQKELPHHKN